MARWTLDWGRRGLQVCAEGVEARRGGGTVATLWMRVVWGLLDLAGIALVSLYQLIIALAGESGAIRNSSALSCLQFP